MGARDEAMRHHSEQSTLETWQIVDSIFSILSSASASWLRQFSISFAPSSNLVTSSANGVSPFSKDWMIDSKANIEDSKVEAFEAVEAVFI